MSDIPEGQEPQPDPADVRTVRLLMVLILNSVLLRDLDIAAKAKDKESMVRHLGSFAGVMAKEHGNGAELLQDTIALAQSLGININMYQTPEQGNGMVN